MTHRQAEGHLPAFVAKMKNEGLQPLVIDTFAYYYNQVLSGETGLLYDREIQPVALREIKDFDRLKKYAAAGRRVLQHCVRIVLNGGLGTTMGLTGPKSLIEAKNGKNFLEIILQQADYSGVRLALMNSFNTHAATCEALAQINPPRAPLQFIQHKFPKIRQTDLQPATWPDHPDLEWNPPGHGDIYTAIYASGTLGRLLESGIRYAFVSNSDNLGGIIDEPLLGYFVESKISFMIEVSGRTPSDIKGGHIARRKDGRLVLREISQCPQKDLMNFQNIHCHGFFNTNNIWINLEELNRKITNEGMVRLPMILNPKTLDPNDETSPPVYQIETAMGSAVSLFDDARAVAVERDRFLPVKTCNDLLILRSDRFLLNRDSKLLPNPENRNEAVDVQLDPKFYNKIDEFETRFPFGPPSLTRCSSLIVEGDVRFERNIILKGKVTIRNKRKNQESIKAGTIIVGDVLFKY